LKKVESEMQKLRDASSINNANISLYTQHCPPLLKLVLELGDISEKNSLLNASQRRRLMRYTTDFNLREALMRKGKLKEPNAFSISNVDDSEDDELVEVLENIMSAENSKTGFDSSAKKTQQEGDGNKKMVDMVMPSNSKMIEESKKLSDDSDEEMQMNDRHKQKRISFCIDLADEKKRNKKVVKEKEQKNQTESELRKPPQLQTQSPSQPSLRRSRRLANAALHEETFAEHLQRKLARGLPSSSSLSSASPSTSKISFSDVQHKYFFGLSLF
uniref:HRDC domain-containing protein n=1 Tax=Anisakis simplex TaxID=6269 RepID=A0A0M3KH15_ANISI